MTLTWIKCQSDQWCNFMQVDLAHPHFKGLEGVYIIWHGGQQPATVYVGQGRIADRLQEHRQRPEILQFTPTGLFVTWARVDSTSRDGVERFLADTLRPKIPGPTARYPQSLPIRVNLPW